MLANIAKQAVTGAGRGRTLGHDRRRRHRRPRGPGHRHRPGPGRAGPPAGQHPFRGVEPGSGAARWCPTAGFDVTLLPGRGIARRLTIDNVGAVAGLARGGRVRAVALLGRLRPAVVITVGGYASVAGALAAVVWRVPLVVAEQNAVPGLANRLAGRFAAACAVSFPGTPLRRAVVTGNPVRRQILAVDRCRPGGPRPAPPSACPPTASWWRSRAVRSAPGASTRRSSAWPRCGPTARTSPSATWSGERDFDAVGRRQPEPGAGRAHLSAGPLRGSHGPAALGGRRGGAAGRGQHRRRADRGRRAGHPGAPSRRARRPPDSQRPAAGRGRRRGGDPGRTSSTPPGWPLEAHRTGSSRGRPWPGRGRGRAALAEVHARGPRRRRRWPRARPWLTPLAEPSPSARGCRSTAMAGPEPASPGAHRRDRRGRA